MYACTHIPRAFSRLVTRDRRAQLSCAVPAPLDNPGVMILLVLSTAAAAGVDIVTPSPAQLRYQDTDFIALIHFNMGTFAHNGDPCCDESNWDVKASYAAGKTSDPATFNPKKLNTTQWVRTYTRSQARHAPHLQYRRVLEY